MVYLPLWKIWKSVGKDYSQYIMENKKCSKPPTSDFKLLGLTQVSWWTPQCVASKLPWQPDIRTPSAPAGCRLSAPKPWFVTKEPTENGYKWITRLGKPSFFWAWEDGILTDFLVATWPFCLRSFFWSTFGWTCNSRNLATSVHGIAQLLFWEQLTWIEARKFL